MKKYIVLLRGVNVGGKNLLPMNELKELLEESGFKGVSTYIQSGNIVLMSSQNPEVKVKALIQSKFGFSAQVLAISEKNFDLSINANPYAENEGKTVHFYFCERIPAPDYSKLDAKISESERYTVIGKVLYLHAPDGIGRSKLVGSIESCLGVSATGRNLNTINKLANMVHNP